MKKVNTQNLSKVAWKAGSRSCNYMKAETRLTE